MEPLLPTRSLGEDSNRLAPAGELDGCLDSLEVALAAADREEAEASKYPGDRPAEELRFPHPLNLARVQRIGEREAVEVGYLVGGQHEASARRQVFEAVHTGPEQDPDCRSREGGYDPVRTCRAVGIADAVLPLGLR